MPSDKISVLANKLKYNLRKTQTRSELAQPGPSRIRKLRKKGNTRKRSSVLNISVINPADTSQHTSTNSSNMAQIVQTYHGPKFCGNIAASVPDRTQLASYDVDQWLKDADNRIGSRNITDERLRIAEAKLSSHPTIGDAHVVLNRGSIGTLTNYEEFKRQCRLIWQPKAKSDRFFALAQFADLPYQDGLADFMARLDESKETILKDIRGFDEFKVGPAADWTGADA